MNCPINKTYTRKITGSLISCLTLVLVGCYGIDFEADAADNPDTTAPTIINVTSDSINKTFVTGNNVNVKVTFSEPVWLTRGYVRVLLETGVIDHYANYTSGHGTNTISFTYAVTVNDNSPDLDYVSTNSLDLQGDTIKDAAGNNAVLTLPAPGTAGSLSFNKNIVIDTVAPSVKSTSPLTGGHVNGNTLISFTDSEPTNPQCSINNSTWVNCVSGVTVLSGLTGFNLLSEGATFTLYIKDTDSVGYTGTNNVTGLVKNSAPPTLSNVHISSGNSNPSWAKMGDTVTITLTADQSISAPTITIAGQPAQVSGANTNWSGSYQMSANDPEGVVIFSVTFADTTGISGTTVSTTTDGSTVTFDKISPTATVSYSTQTFTAGSVTATISPIETVTITNNSGLVSYTFADNGSFTFNFTDTAGNTGSATATVQIIDNTPPSSDLSGIGDGWKREDVTLTFSCSDDLSGCGSTYYTTDGSNPTTNSSVGTLVTLSTDGIYTIKYFSVDQVGNKEAVKTATHEVKIDKTFPTGSITQPSSGSIVSGTQTIYATAGDGNGAGVSKVEFYYDSISAKVSQDTTSPYSIDWDTVTVPGGSHNLYIKVYDTAGNESGLLAATPVTVANTSPGVSATGSSDSWKTNNISITLSISGTGSPATLAKYNWDQPATAALGTSFINNDVINIPSDGTHTLYLYAEESNGNSISWSGIYKLDTKAPSKPLMTPEGGDYIGGLDVLFGSSDETSGIDSVYYSKDGSDPGKTSLIFSPGLPVPIDASVIIKVAAFDKAGNRSEINSRDFGIAPHLSSESYTSSSNTSVIIAWITDHPSTSRVVYDTSSHVIPGNAPNYGYSSSTNESDTDSKVTLHSVTITGLTAGTTYYYRVVSRGSPENAGSEKSFTTPKVIFGTTINSKSTDAHEKSPQIMPTVETPADKKLNITGEIKGESINMALPDSFVPKTAGPKEAASPFPIAILVPSSFAILVVFYFLVWKKDVVEAEPNRRGGRLLTRN